MWYNNQKYISEGASSVANNNGPRTELSTELTAFLQGPNLVLITTLDSDTKWPTNNLITWVLAKDSQTLRLCADAKGRVLGNIRSDERILLTVMTGGACHTIEGTARVIAEEISGTSIKLGVAEVQVKAVRDVTFFGGKLTQDPAYTVTYDPALKEKLDVGVFGAMRSL
jgi:hypothetical protein